MALAHVEVPPALLAELLDLPPDVEVMGTVRVVIQGPTVPEPDNGPRGAVAALKYQRDELEILSLVAIEPSGKTEEVV